MEIGWTKVREKLPLSMEGVLIYSTRTGMYRIDYLIVHEKIKGAWAYSGELDNATHWLPLPEPPSPPPSLII